MSHRPIYVYVACPFEDAPIALDLHTRLRAMGASPTSTWALQTDGRLEPKNLTAAQYRAAASDNDNDVQRSDVVLVIAREGAGGEMFAEARFALTLGKRVIWVGRRILSAYRTGVQRVDTIEEALALIAREA